jgi:TM2 domain-containing membrane protein YozV
MAKFCTNCGSPLENGKNTCVACGHVVGGSVSGTAGVSSNTNTNSNTNYAAPPKSKIAAGLLGIFLGGFGVHNFYLGYAGKGVAQLLITILSCGVLGFVSGLWGFIEGILILAGSINTDAYGNPLGN